MILRLNKSRRCFSVVLVVWFVFLSVTVHALHRHPGVRIGQKVDADLCPISGHYDSSHDKECLRAPSEGENPGSRIQGLCPICLFLAKHSAECRNGSLNPTPKSEGARYSTYDSIAFDSFLDVPAASPRAPPC